MFPLGLVPTTVMHAKVFLPVLLVMKIMNFSLTERALIFAKKILSTALKTNHAKNATFPSQIATNAMKMELPVLLVMLVGKF